jgi:Tol biopolymer transport system component
MRRRRTRSSAALVLVLASAGCRRSEPPLLEAAGPPFDLVYEKVIGGNKDLYVVQKGQTAERRLTDDPAEDMLPRFSKPDGRSVIFSSSRTGTFQLFEVPLEGGVPRRLRETHAKEFQADPSPDGRRLAFLSYKTGPECLFVMDRATGRAQPLVCHKEGSVLGNPHWSPDGTRIVFSSNVFMGHQIYIVDLATGVQTRLSGMLSGGCEPRFSPDGRHVVHVSRGHHLPRSWLVEHDLDSGQARVLVGWPALNYDPVYAPDGSEIAFASNVGGDFAIYRQRLSDGRSWRVSEPGWSRDPDYAPRR